MGQQCKNKSRPRNESGSELFVGVMGKLGQKRHVAHQLLAQPPIRFAPPVRFKDACALDVTRCGKSNNAPMLTLSDDQNVEHIHRVMGTENEPALGQVRGPNLPFTI